MVDKTPDFRLPVQEVLAKMQADIYQRGWNDAMAAIAAFATTGNGTRPASGGGSRGPNRNSIPSRILALLDSGPVANDELLRLAQAAIPGAAVAIINRSIARLLDRKLMVRSGSMYAKAGQVPIADIPEEITNVR